MRTFALLVLFCCSVEIAHAGEGRPSSASTEVKTNRDKAPSIWAKKHSFIMVTGNAGNLGSPMGNWGGFGGGVPSLTGPNGAGKMQGLGLYAEQDAGDYKVAFNFDGDGLTGLSNQYGSRINYFINFDVQGRLGPQSKQQQGAVPIIGLDVIDVNPNANRIFNPYGGMQFTSGDKGFSQRTQILALPVNMIQDRNGNAVAWNSPLMGIAASAKIINELNIGQDFQFSTTGEWGTSYGKSLTDNIDKNNAGKALSSVRFVNFEAGVKYAASRFPFSKKDSRYLPTVRLSYKNNTQTTVATNSAGQTSTAKAVYSGIELGLGVAIAK